MDIKERIIEDIKEYEWDNVNNVLKSIIPNIIFSMNNNESEPDLLDSRFGGSPAVPSGFNWPLQPLSGNSPLTFFFQLNFKQIKPFDVDNILPNDGILVCFASVTDDIMWEPEIPNAFKSYYFPDTENLTFGKIPENIPIEERLKSRSINYKNSFQLPRYPFNYASDELSVDDAYKIDEVANIMFDEYYSITMKIEMTKGTNLRPPSPKDDFHTLFSHNLILGIPFSVQHYIAEEWSEIYSGGDEEPKNYINLISFEMKKREGNGFSDNGAHIYLCINKEDLKNKDLKKIIHIVQNT